MLPSTELLENSGCQIQWMLLYNNIIRVSHPTRSYHQVYQLVIGNRCNIGNHYDERPLVTKWLSSWCVCSEIQATIIMSTHYKSCIDHGHPDSDTMDAYDNAKKQSALEITDLGATPSRKKTLLLLPDNVNSL